MELIWVKSAKYIRDFIVEVEFSDGSVFTVNLENSLDGPIYQPLRNKDYFKNFRVEEADTLSWENGADFSPEFLYELGKKQAHG